MRDFINKPTRMVISVLGREWIRGRTEFAIRSTLTLTLTLMTQSSLRSVQCHEAKRGDCTFSIHTLRWLLKEESIYGCAPSAMMLIPRFKI